MTDKVAHTCTIHKSSGAYRIVVKSARKSIKLQYVTGYVTEKAAKDDWPKLLLHLQSNQRIRTFKKQMTDKDIRR